jgi:hypothetical protein
MYREATPESLRSAPEICDTMNKAQDKLIKSIRSRNFEKFISVAHKDNGEAFFYEVRLLSFFLSDISIVQVHLDMRSHVNSQNMMDV